MNSRRNERTLTQLFFFPFFLGKVRYVSVSQEGPPLHSGRESAALSRSGHVMLSSSVLLPRPLSKGFSLDGLGKEKRRNCPFMRFVLSFLLTLPLSLPPVVCLLFLSCLLCFSSLGMDGDIERGGGHKEKRLFHICKQ